MAETTIRSASPCGWLAAAFEVDSHTARPISWLADAIENRVHVHDLHTTILHLLGLDHKRLTYRFAGRDYRLTDVYGEIVEGVLLA